jgi:hypothetical protein
MKLRPGDFVCVAQKDFFDERLNGAVGEVVECVDSRTLLVYFPSISQNQKILISMLEKATLPEKQKIKEYYARAK